MFLEFLTHLLALDFQWMIDIFMHNLHYFFAFAAMMFFFLSQKGSKFLLLAFVFAFWTWIWIDFQTLTGWVLFGSAFLMLLYVTKIATITFAENVPEFKGRLMLVNTLSFIIVFIAFNLLLRLGVI